MSMVKKVDEMMATAAHHREQLHALAKDFAALHSEPAGSCQADELMHVILDGQPYDDAMARVMQLHKSEHVNSNVPQHGSQVHCCRNCNGDIVPPLGCNCRN